MLCRLYDKTAKLWPFVQQPILRYEIVSQKSGIYDLIDGIWELNTSHQWICWVMQDIKNNQRFDRFEG